MTGERICWFSSTSDTVPRLPVACRYEEERATPAANARGYCVVVVLGSPVVRHEGWSRHEATSSIFSGNTCTHPALTLNE